MALYRSRSTCVHCPVDDSDDGLIDLPAWGKRRRQVAKPKVKRQTLAERLREKSGDDKVVIDLAQMEADLERLRQPK